MLDVIAARLTGRLLACRPLAWQIGGVPTSDGMADIPQAVATALQDRYVLERELSRGGMATV